MKRLPLVLIASTALVMFALQVVAAPPPEDKTERTPLGLYLTAKEAFAKWHVKPKETYVLDVRTSQEYQLVGHALMARNIPYSLWTDKWDDKDRKFSFKANPDFLEHVKNHYKPDDEILVMCRSGGRAARAVTAMANAGFKKVYVIVDSFEGDKVTDPASYYVGKRMKNGWRNSGAPWGYDQESQLVYKREEPRK